MYQSRAAYEGENYGKTIEYPQKKTKKGRTARQFGEDGDELPINMFDAMGGNMVATHSKIQADKSRTQMIMDPHSKTMQGHRTIYSHSNERPVSSGDFYISERMKNKSSNKPPLQTLTPAQVSEHYPMIF